MNNSEARRSHSPLKCIGHASLPFISKKVKQMLLAALRLFWVVYSDASGIINSNVRCSNNLVFNAESRFTACTSLPLCNLTANRGANKVIAFWLVNHFPLNFILYHNSVYCKYLLLANNCYSNLLWCLCICA